MKRRTVADVMTRHVVTVTEDTPFAEIADVLAEHRVSGVPVLDEHGGLAGIVTEADLLRKEEYRNGDSPRSLRAKLRRRGEAEVKAAAVDARGLMTSRVVTVHPHTSIAEAARLLNAHGFKAAPVVDDGRLVGIVARRDLLSVFQRSDEDIRDEVISDVLVVKLWQDPADLHVRVEEGVVHLTGRVEQKSLIPIAVRMTAATEGVVDVVHDVAYDHDDTGAASSRRR